MPTWFFCSVVKRSSLMETLKRSMVQMSLFGVWGGGWVGGWVGGWIEENEAV